MSRLAVDLVRCLVLFKQYNVTNVSSASKFMIDTGAGVIDADYRGIVFVLLFNLSEQDFTGERHCLPFILAIPSNTLSVNEGDRIAQLVLERIVTPDVVEVQVRVGNPCQTYFY